MTFLEDIKNRIKNKQATDIFYYGPSTTAVEYTFPNWGEIVKYALKSELEKGFPDFRDAYWNVFTHNMGLDGAKSEDLLARFKNLILDRKPDLLFLHAGANDFYFKVDIAETEKNIRLMIKQSLDQGMKVIYWTAAPSSHEDRNKAYETYHQTEKGIIQDFSTNPNFLFVDIFSLFPKEAIAKSYTLIEPQGNEVIGLKAGDLDYVHFNRYGNAIIAKIFLKEVFGIDFNADIFIESLNDQTNKYPKY